MFMQLFIGLVRAIGKQRARHLAKRHLAQADDYLLRDIGIDRSQIDLAVEGQLGDAHNPRADRPVEKATRGQVVSSNLAPTSIGSTWSISSTR